MAQWTNQIKQQTRKATIAVYTQYVGKPPQEYWTLAGQCVSNGEVIKGSELDQMLKAGFIKPNQFHGVDKAAQIIKANSDYAPAHWYLGDFIEALSQQERLTGVINFDSIWMQKKGLKYLYRLLHNIQPKCSSGTMVLANFVTACYGKKSVSEHLIADFKSLPGFNLLEPYWMFHPQVLEYTGTQRSKRVKMATIYMFRTKNRI